MSNGFLLRSLPFVFDATCSSTSGINANFPVANMLNPQPKVVMQTNAGGNPFETYFEIYLGGDVTFDTLAVLFTNMSSAAKWKAYGFTAASGGPAPGAESAGALILGFGGYVNFGVTPTAQLPRRHAIKVGNPTTVCWVRIYVIDYAATNPEGLTRIGNVLIGNRLQPAWNYESGGGRRIDDRSTMRELPGGELGGMRAAKVPIIRTTWGDLTEAELLRLWDLLNEVGESEPVLLVEDPDETTGQQERLYYGTLIGLDFWERGDSDKSRIELRLRAWL